MRSIARPEIGPVRALEAEAVREIVELEPHRVVEIGLERDPADDFRHSSPPIVHCRVIGCAGMYHDTVRLHCIAVKMRWTLPE